MMIGCWPANQRLPWEFSAKVLDLEGSDKLTILRGCPGLPGAVGSKGDAGVDGARVVLGGPYYLGQRAHVESLGCTFVHDACVLGVPGKAGPPGPKHRQRTGSLGERDREGQSPFPRSLEIVYDLSPGWGVLGLQTNSSVNFCNWASCKQGSGSQLGEFWLGNENIHTLTTQGTSKLRVDLVDFEGKYTPFKAASRPRSDSLPSHKDCFFSTTDQDSDLRSPACGTLDVCCPTWMVSTWGGPHKSSENGINWKSQMG
ncbi:unnamed protein product [Nyctereutes procyonoides]|uniref:(raccoon dog) hypothetical protein n=1 Tax=Nyctereutes procyonoides TaxID=34880 RepID=A0A811XY97_NYCPR|nr:unnamed protein product [Nyctereutes procyonoides]